MRDIRTEAEVACNELRRSWVDLIRPEVWAIVCRDDVMMEDLRSVLGGMEMKLREGRKAA
jgi:hypothetical protein